MIGDIFVNNGTFLTSARSRLDVTWRLFKSTPTSFKKEILKRRHLT